MRCGGDIDGCHLLLGQVGNDGSSGQGRRGCTAGHITHITRQRVTNNSPQTIALAKPCGWLAPGRRAAFAVALPPQTRHDQWCIVQHPCATAGTLAGVTGCRALWCCVVQTRTCPPPVLVQAEEEDPELGTQLDQPLQHLLESEHDGQQLVPMQGVVVVELLQYIRQQRVAVNEEQVPAEALQDLNIREPQGTAPPVYSVFSGRPVVLCTSSTASEGGQGNEAGGGAEGQVGQRGLRAPQTVRATGGDIRPRKVFDRPQQFHPPPPPGSTGRPAPPATHARCHPRFVHPRTRHERAPC